MKVPFNIKFRPQIESGEYKVILDCGVEAEILAWDKPGEYPIVCMAKKEGAIPFRTDNNGIAYHYPESSSYSDLFVILPLPDNIFKQAVDAFGADHQIGMLHEEVGELLAAINQYARGRVEKEAVVTEIADVMIMCEQMAEIFGREETEAEKRKKIDRLAGEIEKSLSLHSCSI